MSNIHCDCGACETNEDRQACWDALTETDPHDDPEVRARVLENLLR